MMSNFILAVAFVLATAIVVPVAADDATQDATSSTRALEEALKEGKLITAIKEEQAKQDEADD